MEWEEIVGENIKRHRKQRGLTQEQLAMSADLNLRYLGGIERGEYNPTISVLSRLAEVLEIHPSDLFNDRHLDLD